MRAFINWLQELDLFTPPKRAGMRWSVNGANTITTFRYRISSKRLDDYWHSQATKFEFGQ